MPFADRIAKANQALDFDRVCLAAFAQAPTPVIYGNLLLRNAYAQPGNDELKRRDLDDAGKLLQTAWRCRKAAGRSEATAGPSHRTRQTVTRQTGGHPKPVSPPSLEA